MSEFVLLLNAMTAARHQWPGRPVAPPQEKAADPVCAGLPETEGLRESVRKYLDFTTSRLVWDPEARLFVLERKEKNGPDGR